MTVDDYPARPSGASVPMSGPRWRLAALLVYGALAAGGFAALAPGLTAALRVLARPFSYEPALSAPWGWLGLAAALLSLLWRLGQGVLAGERVGLRRYGMLLAVVACALVWRRQVAAPPLASPDDALRHAAARAVHALQAAYRRDGRYPASAESLDLQLPEAAVRTGLWRRLLRSIGTHVAFRTDATEPLLTDEGQGPGTVVVALDASRQRFWVTAFGLGRTGAVEPVSDGSGHVLTAAGASGRPVSRGLEAFFEYPRKTALPVLGTPP
jgi:hypothetical protein